MATTFDQSLATNKDYIRFRTGDTNGDPQWFLSDETITGLLTRLGSVNEACAQAAESIGAICAQKELTVQQKSLKIQYGDRAQAMYDLAKLIRSQAQPGSEDPRNIGAGTTCLVGAVTASDLLLDLPCREGW